MRQSRRLMLHFDFRCDTLVVAKPAAQKSAALRPAQPLPCADEPAQNRAAVIAGEVHGTVEVLAAQGADDWPGFAAGWRFRAGAASARRG